MATCNSSCGTRTCVNYRCDPGKQFTSAHTTYTQHTLFFGRVFSFFFLSASIVRWRQCWNMYPRNLVLRSTKDLGANTRFWDQSSSTVSIFRRFRRTSKQTCIINQSVERKIKFPKSLHELFDGLKWCQIQHETSNMSILGETSNLLCRFITSFRITTS